MSRETLAPGTVFQDCYEILSCCRATCRTVIYRGRLVAGGRPIVLQILRVAREGDGVRHARRCVSRFLREMRCCTRLRHPPIVRPIAWGHAGEGRVYAIFELTPGHTLKEVMLALRQRPPSATLRRATPEMGSARDDEALARREPDRPGLSGAPGDEAGRTLARTDVAPAVNPADVTPEERAREAGSLPAYDATTVGGMTPVERAPGSALPDVGATIKHYEIIRKLGRGGMGRLYLARDTKLGRLVAIKLLIELSRHGNERFLAEARATALCRHENIVVIHEVDEIRGQPYLVLEYIKGRTLSEWLAQREHPSAPGPFADARPSGPMSSGQVIELILPVVRALVCAHALGIVHRDLKPENILIDDAGWIKVVDFGIAKQLDVRMMSTITGAAGAMLGRDDGESYRSGLIGTPRYMSPEQLLGEDIDPRSDLWAVGIVLYTLLVGAHPLDPFSFVRLAEIVKLDLPMPRVSARRPDVGVLGDLVDRCLQKRKEERIGSAKELLAELEALLPGRKALDLGQDESPFAGLSAFQESDAARFFGRDQDVTAMTARLRSQPLVTVAGPSGAGKSSFVRAGVIPALKRSSERWETFIVRPGRRPLSALVDVLVQVAERERAGAPASPAELADHDEILATLRTQPGHLGARLRSFCRREGARHHALLFVDQFEELYTLGASREERAAFVACLEGVADDASSPLRVLLAIRSDFLDHIAEDHAFMTGVARGLSLLPPVGREGLREALTRPIEATGYRFETEEMVEELLGTLECTRSPLPLLQFTAAKLWEARNRERRLLTRESYEKLGGVAGALSAHADAVLSALPIREQRLARAVLVRLVTPERTRAVVSLEELSELAQDAEGGTGEAIAHVVQHLAGARLLLIEAGGEREGTTVELVHESLIERWPKLRKWLAEGEQDAQFLARLRASAQQWEASGHAEGLLWRDRAADEARAWYERRRAAQGVEWPAGLGKREERYLLAVVELAERARRLRRRLIMGVIGTLGAIALIVSYLAIRAGQEAARTQIEAREARNATRMAAARELAADPTTALAILREVEPPDVPHGWAVLARSALHRRIARVVLIHPDGIRSAAWSPDGKHIVTASLDKTARVWNADGTGEPLVLHGHEAPINSVAWSPDGKRIVTASEDKTARVWNADGTGEPLVFRGHDAPINSAAWSPDGKRIVTASEDKTARVWNADGTGKPLVLRGHDHVVSSAGFSPDGKRIVTASWDRTARVWNADGAGESLVLQGHENEVTAAGFSPDGKRIVTASLDETARVWNADGTGQPLVLRGHEHGVYSAGFSPDGKRIVTASMDKTARVWNADSGGKLLVLRGHQEGLCSAAFSADGKRIVTASYDRTARVWDADGMVEPVVMRGHEHLVISSAWSPDGKRIVTASYDGTARVWSADGSGEPLILRGEAPMYSAAWSPDGKRIVAASMNKTAIVWNADGTGEPMVLPGHEDWVTSAAFSPDGKRIVTASYDKTARVWNADGTGEALVLRGHKAWLYSAAFSPDGRRIVTASRDKTVRVWNAGGKGEPLVLWGHEGLIYSAAFSPDGKRIVTASQDKTARVWNADGTGEALVLRGHEDWVDSAAWSPDGKRIVTASQDGMVRVWNADGTGEALVLRISDFPVNAAAFSPDGKRLVTASDDAVVRLWTDLEPLHGVDDPKLWTATTYCMPIEQRIELLRVPKGLARTHQEACQRRVEAARAAAPGSPLGSAARPGGARSP
ncbi:nSTAND1 domain-containing NTPase [Sorangium sp. So ce1000]|uniref:nSTAND1 domain-containing NTPase n=1 Tax=Sorangium sp. So ce1000 TaxID=3133325 RepID=UPI003F612E69